MKRVVPATPFKVDGPNSTWTSSTDSPEKLVEQMSIYGNQPDDPAQEVATVTKVSKRGQGSASAAGGSAHWGGSTESGHQSLRRHNTIQQNMYQQQINQIDPAQLDQLLESLVKAKAEANYQQLRQTAQRQVDAIRQQAGNDHQALQGQVYQKLSQLNQEKTDT